MPAPVASKKHLYEVLGLKDDASEDAIRVAYKKLALKWHPDRHQEDKEIAQEKFIEIKDAYTTLLESRKHSRRFKRSQPTPTPTSPPPTAPSTSSSHSSSPSTAPPPSAASSSKSESDKTHKARSSRSSEAKAGAVHPSNGEKKSTETKAHSSRFTPKPDLKHTKLPRAATPFSHLDSDSSSDEDDTNDHYPGHSKSHKGSHSSSNGKKYRPLEEDGYEFIDFGCPLQPLRAPSLKGSTKSGKSADSAQLSKDWIFPLPLSLNDLYHGASQHYRIIRTLRSGKTQTVKIDIKVLPGWHKGTRIRVPGVGNERKDGTFQDIVFVVEEQSHPQFSRSGNDLYVTVQVPWADNKSRPYSWSTMDSRLDDDGDPAVSESLKEDLAFVKGLNAEEYALPIPVSLVEGADGTRIVGAGMPIREKGEVVGKGDLVIRWEFIFPETEKAQQSRWQSLKKRAMNWKL
ncbi:DnaJ-domain-containing protein [Cristinia sonorae]|uniref:DnaJ-domain-containing protein n=1 Tax=Cristinia sonorae TaxID=1940300 RepID=A0A8K0XQD3_9AGAR|nr:DnaJ-domain-containing protein [Cristinia sonorae]